MEASKVRRFVAKELAGRYGRGRGPSSAWEHMSEAQQKDARLAAAARLVLLQGDDLIPVLRFSDAVGTLLDSQDA